ncbi:MAG: hypothetical protein J4F36_13890 [Nitrosopumilaceae archaeon]|nr:hypothetical protein [Nitrosopumilaceae archaeon]
MFGMAMVLFLYHVLTNLDEFGRSVYYGGDPMASIIYIFVILPLIFLLIGGSSIYYGIRIISKT